MTDAEALALGRRAVACKRWRWMAGMLVIQPGPTATWGRLRNPDAAEWLDRGEDEFDEGAVAIPRAGVPDLRDPATVGCLLALVQEVSPHYAPLFVAPCLDGRFATYAVYTYGPPLSVLWTGATPAEALVNGIEAAPSPATRYPSESVETPP